MQLYQPADVDFQDQDFYIVDYVNFLGVNRISWTTEKEPSVRIIEAALLKLPLPKVISTIDSNGFYHIVAGANFINSLSYYITYNNMMEGFHSFVELEGARFSEIAPQYKRRILETSVRMMVATQFDLAVTSDYLAATKDFY